MNVQGPCLTSGPGRAHAADFCKIWELYTKVTARKEYLAIQAPFLIHPGLNRRGSGGGTRRRDQAFVFHRRPDKGSVWDGQRNAGCNKRNTGLSIVVASGIHEAYNEAPKAQAPHEKNSFLSSFRCWYTKREEVVVEFTMTHMVLVTGFGFSVTIGTILYKTGEWKGTVKGTLKDLAQKTEALTQRVDKLTQRVDKIHEVFFQRGVAATLENKSLLQLNQLGQDIAKTLDLDALADAHTLLIKDQAEALGPYEIQQLCFRYAQEDLLNELRETSPDQYEAISRTAYQHGISREDILKIVGVLLRDKVLRLVNYSDTNP